VKVPGTDFELTVLVQWLTLHTLDALFSILGVETSCYDRVLEVSLHRHMKILE
jgi:hypothetical protein